VHSEGSAFHGEEQKKQILRFLESDGLHRSPEIGTRCARNDRQVLAWLGGAIARGSERGESMRIGQAGLGTGCSSQNVPAQVLVLDDVRQLVLDVDSVDTHRFLLQIRALKGDLVQ